MALGVVEAVLMFIRRWVVARATLGVETAIRMDLYAHLQRLPMGFHGQWQSGQLLSRVMSDLSARCAGSSASACCSSSSTSCRSAVVTAILLQHVLAAGPGRARRLGARSCCSCCATSGSSPGSPAQVQDQTGDLATSVEEGAHGLRVIKAFGRADHVFARFDERALRLQATSMEKVRVSARFWTFLEVIPNVALIIVLGFGAIAAGQGRLTMGTLVAFITLMLSLVWPVASLGFLLSMTQEAMTAADRITEVLDTEPERARRQPRAGPRRAGALRFARRRVPVPRRPARRPARRRPRRSAAGETVAVVGATGSGKTVLTSLVPRLYDVTAGSITIDGHDIRSLTLDSLRSVVATAFEEPTLFSMSVRENLTLGRPDATPEQIAEALDVAQAGFVYDLPWGLDTRIGEQGMSLSGGQRQRLALARAVLARPTVLVLDDTLSALDVHTEALVEEALRRVLADVTAIVVAHRASTVLLADRVALLQDGTITHVGTHAELLAEVPAYRHLLAADDEMAEAAR